jgi:hypothetical protein
MNLLRIQDALKNASDQQLMQLMQAPDSTAPSYLVLSEIRRRKDMRAQQAPEGQPDRTVAEELTAPEGQGIRSMQMPEEPPQEASPQSGIEAMREGGVVRMEAGGQPPSPYISETTGIEYPFTTGSQDPVIFGRPLHSYSLQELARLRSFERYLPGASRGAIPMEDINRRIDVLRGRAQPRFQESPALDENVPSLEGIGSRELANRIYESSSSLPVFGGEEGGPPTAERPTPTTTTTAQPGGQQRPPAAQPPVAQPPAAQPPVAQQSPRPAAPQPPRPAQGGGQQDRPGGVQARPAGGGGGGSGGGGGGGGGSGVPTPASAPAVGMPTMADIYRQNQGLFADGIGALRERAQQERVDPAARRSEAANMALIEAGLRIAGSRNPSLIGAIGEGALPAVQSYGQQLGQIRSEQREARRDELELAKQELNRQLAVGQISATEFRTRMDNVNANLRAASAERAAGIRAGASEAAADRRATGAEAAADRRANAALELERVRAQNRPIDLTGIPSLISTTATQIRNVQGELSLLGGEPPREIRGRPNPEHQRWSALTRQLEELNKEMTEYRGLIRSGLPTRGATGQAGAGAGGQGSGISQFGG